MTNLLWDTTTLTKTQRQMWPSILEMIGGVLAAIAAIVFSPILIPIWIAMKRRTIICVISHPRSWKERDEWIEDPEQTLGEDYRHYVRAHCRCGREWIDDHFNTGID